MNKYQIIELTSMIWLASVIALQGAVAIEVPVSDADSAAKLPSKSANLPSFVTVVKTDRKYVLTLLTPETGKITVRLFVRTKRRSKTMAEEWHATLKREGFSRRASEFTEPVSIAAWSGVRGVRVGKSETLEVYYIVRQNSYLEIECRYAKTAGRTEVRRVVQGVCSSL